MLRLSLFFACVVLLSGCGSPGSTPAVAVDGIEKKTVVNAAAANPPGPALGLKGKITLSGSSTVAPICVDLGKRLEASNPALRVDSQTGGSGRGIGDLRSGAVDIGMISRQLKDDEKDLMSFTIARDGVCVILHKDNRVKNLSDAQVVDIYTGKMTNWKDAGGGDAPITVVNKAEGRSTLELFTHYYKLKNSAIKAHVVIGENEQAIKTVAGNPNAIGYVSIGTAEYDAREGIAIKLMACNGVPATLENVKNEKFPLARPLNLVVKKEPEGNVKAFIDFALSKEANPSIKEQFFVPIKD